MFNTEHDSVTAAKLECFLLGYKLSQQTSTAEVPAYKLAHAEKVPINPIEQAQELAAQERRPSVCIPANMPP